MSAGWNSTERHIFFTISYRFFEKKKLFFTKMYENRTKQVLGELIKKSATRYSILLVSGFVIASLIPGLRKVWPMANNFGPSIALKNQKMTRNVDDAKSLLSAVSNASTRVNLSSYIVNGFCRKYAN